ncbi:VC2046/SO_2500 family protein [uncultured Ferrimonas sp.]|uniref:VC2046/SO_2500 family protein n=1 Tax=uncultured Ferrimonas sp. TaxID=432640 RepID=UPI002618EA20|nr:VC2046/SO_2500 family protein [uncultured Ferrimonas sp.]
MRTDAILVNELQLGDSLSQAVQQDRRGDFSLLLAMMVQDVRFQSQFQLKKDDQGEALPLRQQMQLSEPQPLTEQYQQDSRAQANADAFHQGGLAQSRLQHCLQPEPLDLRGEHPVGLQQALENAEPWQSKREQVAKQMTTFPQQMDLANLIAQQRLQSAALYAA